MSAEGRVLMVDSDGVFRRFAELMLTRRGWAVESVRDAAGAVELLQTSLFDVIVCEASLPDGTGLHLHRRLLQTSRLRSVPFLLVSSDARVANQAAALRSGVDDYLVKPIEGELLVARVEAHVGRARRGRERQMTQRYLLAGDVSVLSFPDLVSTLSFQRQTGVLSVAAPRALGQVHLADGQVVHAEYGNLVGPQAVYRLFAETSARFEFTQERALPAEAHTVSGSVTELFLEAARRHDEGLIPELAGEGPPWPAPQETPVPRATAEDSMLAAQLSAGLADGFALGQLLVWVGEELDAWIRREGHSARLHLHLVADISAGIASLLSVTSPAGERQIQAGLRVGAKAVGLAFHLRGERLVDLVLVDIDDPIATLHALSRSPAITIVAPKGGDAFEVGPRRRVGLDALIRARPPSLLVGVGAASLAGVLSELAPPGARTMLLPGALDDGRLDFRQLLVTCIAAWGERREAR